MNKLPEMWCIQVNEKNTKFIQNERYNKHTPLPNGYIISSLLRSSIKNSWRFEYNKPERFIEISFETFEKLVLGINKKTIYELW
jgi:hypothetical protein